MLSDKIQYAICNGIYLLRFTGDIRASTCTSFDAFINRILSDARLKRVLIDLTDTTNIDSTALGMIAKIAAGSINKQLQKPVALSTNKDVNRILECMGLYSVLDVVGHLTPEKNASINEDDSIQFQEILQGGAEVCTLPADMCCEEELCQQVLDSHRNLIDLNSENKSEFEGLIQQLESELSEKKKH